MIFNLGNDKPDIHPTAFVHPMAEVSGKVKIGPHASIWGGCILRGDIDWIIVGENTNIQDGTIVHTSQGAPVILGNNVTVGHKAMIHGARVDDNCLIGMSVTLLDYSHVETNCLIGAGALVKEKGVIPQSHLAFGIPAKPVRPLNLDEIKMIADRATKYVRLAKEYQKAIEESQRS